MNFIGIRKDLTEFFKSHSNYNLQDKKPKHNCPHYQVNRKFTIKFYPFTQKTKINAKIDNLKKPDKGFYILKIQ